MATQVSCPNCNRSVAWTEDSPHRPFCSERCKLIDLGQWADESHRIPDTEDSDPNWPPLPSSEE